MMVVGWRYIDIDSNGLTQMVRVLPLPTDRSDLFSFRMQQTLQWSTCPCFFLRFSSSSKSASSVLFA